MSCGTNSYDISIKKGSSFYLGLVISDDSGPIDLTGHTFDGQIRASIDSATILASFSFVILNQATNPGEVSVSLTYAQTGALSAPASGINRNITQYVYDIESTDLAGIRTRWIEGLANVSPEVTR